MIIEVFYNILSLFMSYFIFCSIFHGANIFTLNNIQLTIYFFIKWIMLLVLYLKIIIKLKVTWIFSVFFQMFHSFAYYI